MAKEELVGPPFSRWSDPAAWADGTAPQSSNGLDVQLDVTSIANVAGSQSSPFQTNDIVGLSEGLLLLVGEIAPQSPGFLHAHDIQNVADLLLARASGVVVHHDLINVGQLRFFGGGTAEIERGIGSTTFNFQGNTPASCTLILDRPPNGSIDNQVIFQASFLPRTDHIELGGIVFDHADLIPPLPASGKEQIQLTNHGVPVYTLTNVAGASSVSFGGLDQTTGYDILNVTVPSRV